MNLSFNLKRKIDAAKEVDPRKYITSKNQQNYVNIIDTTEINALTDGEFTFSGKIYYIQPKN